jgi:hypothetical protein
MSSKFVESQAKKTNLLEALKVDMSIHVKEEPGKAQDASLLFDPLAAAYYS